ncbi:SpoIIIAH-like family protein [Paenibacillus sp. IB182496]|uniref:SpoIIIAH-like family protein n=1 Tax=Paenibacillus sabuli TaxID=2772509 RepID=A0A927GTF5_9BACL|nr:SpoIIIAH-like family protein [Paenibacillus sabuli]MBD2847291.1 SpoIIIAH-like family protein [Paenibacillus sabuli]
MNTKRQTVWLVSMLSLMVILSAYYLFTDSSTDTLDEAMMTDATEATDLAPGTADEVIVTEVDHLGESGLTAEELKVLEQIEQQDQATVSSDYFTQRQLLRSQVLMEETDRLYSILADTDVDLEEASEAAEQLDALETKDARMTTLEEELLTQYEFGNVVIDEQSDNFNVVVQSEQLDRSEADGIITLAMDTLGISADQVSVQFVP